MCILSREVCDACLHCHGCCLERRLEARVTAEQKDLFREAADLQGVTLTDFVVSSVHQAAMRTLEARRVLDLSRKDQQVFARALLGASAPTARLRDAWRRHSPAAQRPVRATSARKTRRTR